MSSFMYPHPFMLTRPNQRYFRCSQKFPTPKNSQAKRCPNGGNPTGNPTGAEEASALMSLSYDRYLKAGDLYEGYDEDRGNLGGNREGGSSRCGDASRKVQGRCAMLKTSIFIPRFGDGHTPMIRVHTNHDGQY